MTGRTKGQAARFLARLASALMLLALVAPSMAVAQPVRSFAELPRHVRSGQKIYVFLRDGERLTGRFLRLTSDSLSVFADGHTRELAAETVLRIDKRDSVGNGALIGGAILGLAGAAGAGASCSPNCGGAVAAAGLVFGGIGAGIGALIDAAIPGLSPIYIADTRPSEARVTPGEATTAPKVSPEAVPAPAISASGRPWIRLVPREKIQVLQTDGDTVSGLFLTSSADSMTLLVEGSPSQISAARVRRVSRVGHYAKRGFVIGLVAGASADLISLAAGSDGGVSGTFAGAIWGGVIGWAVPRHTVVFDAEHEPPKVSLRVVPLLTRTGTGVSLSVQF